MCPGKEVFPGHNTFLKAQGSICRSSAPLEISAVLFIQFAPESLAAT